MKAFTAFQIIITLGICPIVFTANAQADTSNKVIHAKQAVTDDTAQSNLEAAKAFANIFSSIHDMRANFKQRTLPQNGGKTEISTGTMTIKRPSYFRWQVEQPYPQLIISDTKKVWLYDKELEQVTIQKITNQTNITPAMIFSSSGQSIDKNFVVSQKQLPKSNQLEFILKPKKKDGLFGSFRVIFNKEILDTMFVIDAMGGETKITFSKVLTNKGVSDTLFKFEIPKGVDVIRDE